MGEDETGTLNRLKSLRRELVQPKITEFDGRIVKLMGDGLLAEFSSVVDAVQCAVDIQRSLAERDSELAESNRVRLRIGINLGDVILEGSDIYGDGVNIAARLEGLADPGNICVSETVRTAVGNRLEINYFDMGEQQVKNIANPVRVYRVILSENEESNVTTPDKTVPEPPDKPSIAVLPFANMSNDPDQEYFADGIAEDIITALSQINQWLVIARNSSFAYKGRNVDIREIARELGVRYVLEGSVRKGGERLRVTGQLIEAESGTHLWADKFDGDLDDIFALQDKITESVVGAVEPSLRKAEISRSKRKPPRDFGAYDFYLQALPQLYVLRPNQNLQALNLLQKAIDLDPDYAPALAYMAWGYQERITRDWGPYGDDDAGTAVALARRAIAADRDDALVLSISGFVLVMIGRDYDQGLQAANRARELNPNIAFVSVWAGASLIVSGYPEEGLICIEDAIRVSPGDPGAFIFYSAAALAHLMCGRPAEARDLATQSARIYADWDTTYRVLASALVQLGQLDEARSAVIRLLELAPNMTVSQLRMLWPMRNTEYLEKILGGLRIAGLPE